MNLDLRTLSELVGLGVIVIGGVMAFSNQSSRVDVLYERTAHLSNQDVKILQSIGLLDTKLDQNNSKLIDAFIEYKRSENGINKKSNIFLTVNEPFESDDIEKLKKLKREFSPLPQKNIAEETQILQELGALTTKERNGDLTEEDAIRKGRLERRFSYLKQQRILDSIQKQHHTLDCSVCERLCGPII